MIRVLINGICGKMGRAVYAACLASDGVFSAVAGVDAFLRDADAFGCPVYANIEDVTEAFDVIIDFSVPASLPAVLRYATQHAAPALIGTTGLNERDMRLVRSASERVPVFQTGNMSLGVNLQMELIRLARTTLGEEFDVEIIEKHHRTKIDSPSGTALMLANAISAVSPAEQEYVFGRHDKNKRRETNEIGIHSVRGGTIVGEHEVIFAGSDEILEITHKAFSKQVFVRGALRAARFLVGKKNGLYDMQAVVTEHDVASKLTILENQAVVSVHADNADGAFVSRVFSEIAKREVFVDMIAVSATERRGYAVGFSLDSAKIGDALDAIRALKETYGELITDACGEIVKLSVEGSGMAFRHGVAAKLFSALQQANIEIKLITTSETKIECCVGVVDAPKAIEVLHAGFLA